MATFGVALRATSSTRLAAATNAPTATAPPPPPPPEPLLLWVAPSSLRGTAIQLLIAKHGWNVIVKEVNPMLGAPTAATRTPPTAAAAGTPPPFASLPQLEDGATIISGWISCMRYLCWKAMTVPSAVGFTPGPGVVAAPLFPQFYPLPPGLIPGPSTAASSPQQHDPAASSIGAVAAARASLIGAAALSTAAAPAAAATPASASPIPIASPPPVIVTSFSIDSFLESLFAIETVLNDLSHAVLGGALRTGHSGQLPFLTYRFDRDGGRLLPKWAPQHLQQQQSHHQTMANTAAASSTSTTAHRQSATAPPSSSSSSSASSASLPHHSEDAQAQQHALERSVRALGLFLGDLESRLAQHNTTINAEKALLVMRENALAFDNASMGIHSNPNNNGSATKDPAATAPEEVQLSMPCAPPLSVVASSILSDFRFLLGGSSSSHTLADYTVFVLLQSLPLLRCFLPRCTPNTHPCLFVFCTALERAYGPWGFHGAMGAVSGVDGHKGKHTMLASHPIMQVHQTHIAAMPVQPLLPQASAASMNASPTSSSNMHKRRDTTIATEPTGGPLSVTVSPPTSSSSHAPSPSPSPSSNLTASPTANGASGSPPASAAAGAPSTQQQQQQLSPPHRQVPRLTNVLTEDGSGGSGRGPASSLAVEEVADLMEYVDRVAVRARAATPAPPSSTTAEKGPPRTRIITPTPVPSLTPLIPVPQTSLGWSRILAQRLVHTVEHAPLYWRVLQERNQTRLLTPIETNPAGGAEQSSYRSMAVSTFPVSASVLLSFLWSVDSWKLLDPVQVLECRELAPHPSAPTRARFVYMSIELKSTTSTSTNPATVNSVAAASAAAAAAALAAAPGTRRESDTLPGVTKVSSARVEFVTLNSWRRRADGGYVLLQQSVSEDHMSEINAPKKFGKGCIRANMGGPDPLATNNNAVAAAAATSATPASSGVPPSGGVDPRRVSRWNAATGGCTGWVLRPFYMDGVTPACEVTLLACTSFPARMGSWVGGELEKRTLGSMNALRAKLKGLMGSHPLVQLSAGGMGPNGNGGGGSGGGGSGVGGNGSGVDGRAQSGTIHLRLSQTMLTPSLVHAVSGHGVQSTPHPRTKG